VKKSSPNAGTSRCVAHDGSSSVMAIVMVHSKDMHPSLVITLRVSRSKFEFLDRGVVVCVSGCCCGGGIVFFL
jgi:hypothetical protein